MKYIYNFVLILFVVVLYQQPLRSETYFLDFKYILDQSNAGKKVNKILKEELDQGVKKLKNSEVKLQKEEKDIIQQKKLLSPEDYKKKNNKIKSKSDFSSKRKKYYFKFSF